MQAFLCFFWIISLLASCKSIDAIEDQRFFASGRGSPQSPKATIDTTVSQNKVEIPTDKPIPPADTGASPVMSQTPISDGEAPGQNHGEKALFSGDWLLECHAFDERGDRSLYRRWRLHIASAGGSKETSEFFSDSGCKMRLTPDALKALRFSQEPTLEFDYQLGEANFSGWIAFDYSRAGEATLYLAMKRSGNELMITRACNADLQRLKRCGKLSGMKSEQRAWDGNYSWKLVKI